MKKFLVTFALALAAFCAGFLFIVIVIYVAWYARSYDYLHSPPSSPGDPHDAAGMMLISLEMLFGLPVGVVMGLLAAALVVVRRWNRSVDALAARD